MKDNNCIFCKLANGDIPTNGIYEDDDFKVILDASPATKGHALILPKNHYANMYEIDEEVAAKAIKLAKRIMVHEKKILEYVKTWMNLQGFKPSEKKICKVTNCKIPFI